MAKAFSRTLRSIGADDLSLTLAWSGISLFLLSLWFTWFITAKIPIHQSTNHVLLQKAGSVTSRFSSGLFSSGHRIQSTRKLSFTAFFDGKLKNTILAGQKAIIFLNAKTDKRPGVIDGKVIRVENDPQNDGIRAEIACELPSDTDVTQIGHGGRRIDIEIAQRTPLSLVLQAVRGLNFTDRIR